MPLYPYAPEFAGLDRAQAVQGPGQYLFAGEDAIQIDVLTSVAGQVLTISGTMLAEGLQLLPFSFTVAPVSGVNVGLARVSVDSGWLQHLRVAVTTGAPLLGQTFVYVKVCRGTTGNAIVLGRITAGYVAANTDLVFPFDTPQLPLDGEGAAQRVAVTTPAAGADFSIAVPTNQRWQLIAATGLFTTAVAVANRSPRLIVDDGANIIFEAPAPALQPASIVNQVSWGAGAGGPVVADNATGGAVSSPIPNDLWLPAGFRIRSSTGAIQAADTWTLISLFIRQWMEGN